MSVFVDTDVLVYARDASQPDKQSLAQGWIDRLWEHRQGRLSTQVLAEYYVTVTQKLDPGMSTVEARADVTDLTAWQPAAVTDQLILRAWVASDRFALSFWDALVVAAAQQAGANHLLTEHLQPDQDLGGIAVINPFTTDPDTLLNP